MSARAVLALAVAAALMRAPGGLESSHIGQFVTLPDGAPHALDESEIAFGGRTSGRTAETMRLTDKTQLNILSAIDGMFERALIPGDSSLVVPSSETMDYIATNSVGNVVTQTMHYVASLIVNGSYNPATNRPPITARHAAQAAGTADAEKLLIGGDFHYGTNYYPYASCHARLTPDDPAVKRTHENGPGGSGALFWAAPQDRSLTNASMRISYVEELERIYDAIPNLMTGGVETYRLDNTNYFTSVGARPSGWIEGANNAAHHWTYDTDGYAISTSTAFGSRALREMLLGASAQIGPVSMQYPDSPQGFIPQQWTTLPDENIVFTPAYDVNTGDMAPNTVGTTYSVFSPTANKTGYRTNGARASGLQDGTTATNAINAEIWRCWPNFTNIKGLACRGVPTTGHGDIVHPFYVMTQLGGYEYGDNDIRTAWQAAVNSIQNDELDFVGYFKNVGRFADSNILTRAGYDGIRHNHERLGVVGLLEGEMEQKYEPITCFQYSNKVDTVLTSFWILPGREIDGTFEVSSIAGHSWAAVDYDDLTQDEIEASIYAQSNSVATAEYRNVKPFVCSTPPKYSIDLYARNMHTNVAKLSTLANSFPFSNTSNSIYATSYLHEVEFGAANDDTEIYIRTTPYQIMSGSVRDDDIRTAQYASPTNGPTTIVWNGQLDQVQHETVTAQFYVNKAYSINHPTGIIAIDTPEDQAQKYGYLSEKSFDAFESLMVLHNPHYHYYDTSSLVLDGYCVDDTAEWCYQPATNRIARAVRSRPHRQVESKRGLDLLINNDASDMRREMENVFAQEVMSSGGDIVLSRTKPIKQAIADIMANTSSNVTANYWCTLPEPSAYAPTNAPATLDLGSEDYIIREGATPGSYETVYFPPYTRRYDTFVALYRDGWRIYGASVYTRANASETGDLTYYKIGRELDHVYEPDDIGYGYNLGAGGVEFSWGVRNARSRLEPGVYIRGDYYGIATRRFNWRNIQKTDQPDQN